MHITLYMAMSADGIIAKDGNEDFLSHANWLKLLELAKGTGSFIWGRKTFEAVKTWDQSYHQDIKPFTEVVISKDPNYLVDPGYIAANSPQDAIKKLKSQGFQKTIVTGGSHTNTSFIQANLVNEIIFNLEPTLAGYGTRIFSQAFPNLKLTLLSAKPYTNGIVTLHYQVNY